MANSHDHQPGGHHIVPEKLLTKILLVLFVLTVLTVATAKGMTLGVLAAPVAVIIAVTKALLVMGIFMGLKYEAQTNKLIFASGFFFLALLFIFCVLDIYSRVKTISTL